jgi:integrase/recombinase XerD
MREVYRMDHLPLDHVERYLKYLEVDHSASPNTVAAYRNDLNQFWQYLSTPSHGQDGPTLADPAGDNGDWAGVSRMSLILFVVDMKDKKKYATTTVARKIAALKSFFHYLHMLGLVSVDPTEKLDSPRIDKALPRSLSATEVDGLLDQRDSTTSPDDIRDNAMLRLLYASGLRVSELVALDEGDVDLGSGSVRCISRNGRERIIPLDLGAVQALRVYLDAARLALVRRRDESALFVNHRGDRLTRQGFWLILKDRARRAGLPDDVTPQSLRHSYAIRLIHDNTDLRAVQELLGHANITTTQIYTQMTGRTRRSIDLLGEPQMVG